MNKVNYIRISHHSQNEERQLREGFEKTFIDKCSGVIPFEERPAGKELLSYMEKHPQSTISVKSIDRLGRNTLSILQTIEHFNQQGWVLEVEDLGMNSKSTFFPLMVSLLSTLATHEREMIKERCQEGIRIAQAKGLYQGRKKGTTDNREKTLSKHKDIVLLLDKRVKISDISSITGKTRQTIYKVKNLL